MNVVLPEVAPVVVAEAAAVPMSLPARVDRQIVLPGLELPDVPEVVTITPRNVPAVSGTDECTTAGFDMAVVVLLPDSYDLIGTTDHPFGVPLLDGASVTHPVDTVMARGIPRLASPIIADDRLGEIWQTSVLESDSPDFLDTGNLETVPGLRGCCWSMDFAYDIDPGPDLLVGEFDRPPSGPWGALLLAARPQVVEAGRSDLLARGVSPRTLMPRNFLHGFTHVLPASPVREGWGYIRTGVGSAPPLRDRLVTGSHLFVSPVCRDLSAPN